MKRLSLDFLRNSSHPNALNDALNIGTVVDGVAVEVPDDFQLFQPAETNQILSSIVPSGEWPKWALALKLMRADGDTGVGDTAERVFGSFGGHQFKIAMALAGLNCGCAARKEVWNLSYPYLKEGINGLVMPL